MEYVKRVREAAIRRKAAVDAAAAKILDLEGNKSDNISRWEFEISEARRKGKPLPGSNPYEIYNAKYTELEIELGRAKAALRDELDSILESYVEELHAENTMRGSDINDDAKLLAFELSARDFSDIVNRNASNCTMLRLLRKYADEHEMSDLVPPDLEEEKTKAAKQLRDFCYTASVNYIYSEILMDNDAYIEQVPDVLK